MHYHGNYAHLSQALPGTSGARTQTTLKEMLLKLFCLSARAQATCASGGGFLTSGLRYSNTPLPFYFWGSSDVTAECKLALMFWRV